MKVSPIDSLLSHVYRLFLGTRWYSSDVCPAGQGFRLRRFSAIGACLTIACLCCELGCSFAPADRPELAPVSGIVTLDDQPLGGATVAFNPERGRPSIAVTDPLGRYEVKYLWNQRGAKVGPHTVAVYTAPIDDSGPRRGTVREKLPERYNAKSTLNVDVQPGENVVDIVLVSN